MACNTWWGQAYQAGIICTPLIVMGYQNRSNLVGTKALTKYEWLKMKRDACQKCSLFLWISFIFSPSCFIKALVPSSPDPQVHLNSMLRPLARHLYNSLIFWATVIGPWNFSLNFEVTLLLGKLFLLSPHTKWFYSSSSIRVSNTMQQLIHFLT